MKFIKTIETLSERASRKGIAKINRNVAGWDYYHDYSGKQEVYRVEFDEGLNEWKLFHYGTLTAHVNMDTQEIKEIFGMSVSDADSIETFLYVIGLKKDVRFGYRPVNGGFYCLVGDSIIYLDEYNPEKFTPLVNEALENI